MSERSERAFQSSFIKNAPRFARRSNGENVEPLPIEDAILSAVPMVDQVMLVGDERKSLSAVCVLNVNELVKENLVGKKEGDRLFRLIEEVNDPKFGDVREAIKQLEVAQEKLRGEKTVERLIEEKVKACTGRGGGFRPWESVGGKVLILLEPFAMSNGRLTQSFKIKRNVVGERYGGELD